MARLSEEQIQKIREVYSKVGTYTGTAKICGNSISTVKKYIELNFNKNKESKIKNKNIILFNETIPEANCVYIPPPEMRGEWICLTPDELYEMKELRKEI